MGRQSQFSPEVRERAVRMVRDQEHEYGSRWKAIRSIGPKIGCTAQTLHNWVRKTEPVQIAAATEQARLKELEREVAELRRANEILRKASAFFAQAGTRPPRQVMLAFIDAHREQYGVESICKLLPIAPSTYYEHKARQSDPTRIPKRLQRDAELCGSIRRIWEENFQAYGARKVARLMRQEASWASYAVVEFARRLPVICSKSRWIECSGALSPRDQMSCAWPDFTFVATWAGFVYVAFVIDVFGRRIVRWRVSRSMHTELVSDALDQALYARQVEKELIHHSDHGSQYLSIRYTDRLTENGVTASVGSVGDSYDNALAETVIGLFKTEVIFASGPWRSLEAVEYLTLE